MLGFILKSTSPLLLVAAAVTLAEASASSARGAVTCEGTTVCWPQSIAISPDGACGATSYAYPTLQRNGMCGCSSQLCIEGAGASGQYCANDWDVGIEVPTGKWYKNEESECVQSGTPAAKVWSAVFVYACSDDDSATLTFWDNSPCTGTSCSVTFISKCSNGDCSAYLCPTTP